ncbi:hypothetical protein WKI13_09140 [Teredinibacter turnerae]|uniref:hypothetical protein n=1 Tax=Teredinibacter turnerae TaxID=2426 RepID=UPI0012F8E0CD|nr:hypothetical protein [Teredinibacter turnerae]
MTRPSGFILTISSHFRRTIPPETTKTNFKSIEHARLIANKNHDHFMKHASPELSAGDLELRKAPIVRLMTPPETIMTELVIASIRKIQLAVYRLKASVFASLIQYPHRPNILFYGQSTTYPVSNPTTDRSANSQKSKNVRTVRAMQKFRCLPKAVCER